MIGPAIAMAGYGIVGSGDLNRKEHVMGARFVAAVGIVASVTMVGAGCSVPETPARDDAIVRTDDGPVRGRIAGDHRVFEGIPYAAPPLGGRRWTAPQRPEPWQAPRDATRPGSPCPQVGGFPGDAASTNEDCLYLNVTTPRTHRDHRLPVMVWIHGDGFYQSSGGIYGAEKLAARGDVVVVTLNYRLGAFGFLAHPALNGPGAQHQPGNFGVEDQQAALRWVQRNAAAFGGDPGNVTLFGESAGAASVCTHLAAPGSAGLFHAAIAQSAPCAVTDEWPYPDGNWFARPRADAERDAAEVASKLGCTGEATARCLRSKPVEEIIASSEGGQGFGPVTGGEVLPLGPPDAIASGRFNRVPVVHGTTRDEHRTFVFALQLFSGKPVTDEDYRTEIEGFFGPEAQRVLAQYPRGAYRTASEALADVWTDYSWGCTALKSDRLLSRHVPTYAYEFTERHAPWFKDQPKPDWPTGAYHAAELQYHFTDAYGAGRLPPEQQHLSEQMIRYWTAFARSHDPNGERTPPWPEFQTGHHVQALASGRDGIRPVDLAREHHCGFWGTVRR